MPWLQQSQHSEVEGASTHAMHSAPALGVGVTVED